MMWIAHSRMVAMFAGAWSMYCACTGSFDGTIAIVGVYAITRWIYGNKKSTGTGDADAKHTI